MAIRYIPYFPNTLDGQALLDNFVRTRRMLRYRDNNQIVEHVQRGMPLYEMEEREKVGDNPDDNLVIRGECLSTCAWLKDQGRTIDLVYIDPPFASGADYAKKVYVRRNPKVAKAIHDAEQELDSEEMKSFDEKMYGDIWNKEDYLNWMYENLMAIKSVMSEKSSIYVHLDWHISHYVKVLMDEIFGEENFRNEIIWRYSGWNKKLKSSFEKRHDSILFYSFSDGEDFRFNSYFEHWNSEEEYIKKRKQKPLTDEDGRKYVLSDGGNGKRVKRYIDEAIKEGVVVDDVWELDKLNNSSKESVDYPTQKREALLERIIISSSNPSDSVADFFGGSGVTAAVAARLGRKFVHSDVNINSVLTTRDRLVRQGASFTMMDVKDGVQLFRNPVQTMDKLESLIPGLRKDETLDKFWAGSIMDPKLGMMPVYLPNLLDSSSRLLDKPMMNSIVVEKLPDLPQDTKKVIVYYIDCIDQQELKRFIREQNATLIEVELRDLKRVLDEVVIGDDATWHLEQVQDNLLKVWRLTIDSFTSDRVLGVLRDYNAKVKTQADNKGKKYTPITISDEGLETIEWLSVDTTTADKTAPWHSSVEMYIDRLGYAFINGKPTNEFWKGYIDSDDKPLRLKTRNICGDETIFTI